MRKLAACVRKSAKQMVRLNCMRKEANRTVEPLRPMIDRDTRWGLAETGSSSGSPVCGSISAERFNQHQLEPAVNNDELEPTQRLAGPSMGPSPASPVPASPAGGPPRLLVR